MHLVREAKNLKLEVLPYEAKVEAVNKWMGTAKLDPVKLVRSTLVAQASAAIQKQAMAGGLQISLLRETSSRGVEKELASVQLEGMGPVPALMSFLAAIGNLGVPLVVDTVQLNADPTKPGVVRMSLVIVVLDFDQWKATEVPRA